MRLTKTGLMNPNELRKFALETLGPSRCKTIAFTWDKRSKNAGSWDWEGTITINMARVRSDREIRRTLLHEWVHAQQSYRWYAYYHYKLGYKRNPYEIAARRAEKLIP